MVFDNPKFQKFFFGKGMGGRVVQLDLRGGDAMVVLFCKTFWQLQDMFSFRREKMSL